MLQTEVRLFGAFRDLCGRSTITVSVDESCNPVVLRELVGMRILELAPSVGREDLLALLHSSALASEARVLGPEVMIEPGARLALLPPVCGG